MPRYSFRPQLESLDGRCLPSGVPTPAIDGAVALVAQNNNPQPVTVTISKGFGDFTPGAFSASGGIADSGAFQLIDAHDTALFSPVVGTSHDAFTLTGAQGTITMKSETLFSLVCFDPLVFGQDGHWRIVGGTGDYADLKGEGDYHKLIDVTQGQITITLTGLVHSERVAVGGSTFGHVSDHFLAAPPAPVADPMPAAQAGPLSSPAEFGDVAITLTVDLDAGTRTWSATGSIEDSGTATTVWVQVGAINSPVVSILQIDTLFTNADGTGTFTLRRTVISTADGPDSFVREGTWHVVDATGVHAGLRGHGTLSGTEAGSLVVDTLTGVFTAID